MIEQGAGKSATVNITLQTQAAKAEQNQISANKFLVLVTPYKGPAEQVAAIWDKADKSIVQQFKMNVDVEQPQSNSAGKEHAIIDS